MKTAFDFPTVRQFIADLDSRRITCSDEGKFCSDLDEVLGCHLQYCTQLRDAVNHWAQAVFTGQVSFDPAVEAAFKSALRKAALDAAPHIQHGHDVHHECFDLERLQDLDACVVQINHLLANWVRPERSVSPAARTTPNPETDREVIERLQSLPPFPSNWRPSDARQTRILGRIEKNR